jgi:ubiquinone biosynthesis protein UbiJ
MLKFAFNQVLQHLLGQNAWAKPRLAPFASQSILLKLGVLTQHLIILEDGQLALAGETKSPDAIIQLTPSIVLRMLLQDDAAKMEVNISGDQVLAQTVAQVITHMRWDIEDDLSRIIGDIPANQFNNAVQESISTAKSISKDSLAMFTEYFQEENPLIAKKIQVENFNLAVDALRAQIARVEKKFDKLNTRAQATLHQPPENSPS